MFTFDVIIEVPGATFQKTEVSGHPKSLSAFMGLEFFSISNAIPSQSKEL